MSDRRLVCSGCSCLCDGLLFTDGVGLPDEVNHCSVGQQWFSRRESITTAESFDAADLAAISQWLQQASLPLITGIENLTTEAQQAAVKVADRFFAGIDAGWSDRGRGATASMARYGKVSATFGEIANRSDLVVLWFCDPATTHPRFLERFVRRADKPEKRLIVIDAVRTASAELADEFIGLSSDQASEFVQALRMMLAGPGQPESDLMAKLRSAQYGSVLVGKPEGTEADFDVATDQWFQLVRSLNDHTRFVISSLRDDRNGAGANYVMTSLCGFPNAVRFTEAGPTYNGLEYSTANTIRRRECDMLLVCDIGIDEPFESKLDDDTLQWLKTIPVVVISDLAADRYQTHNVHVLAGTPGWTAAGDFVRSDGVSLPLAAASGQHVPAAAELFNKLLV